MADDTTRRAADKIMEALEARPELRAEIERRMKPRLVIAQNWVEHERGWGQRPDGHTIHLTKEDLKSYVGGYVETHHTDAEAPDEYSAPKGGPKLVKVTEAVYQRLLKQRDKEVSDDEQPYYMYQRYGIWGHHTRWAEPYDGEDTKP